MTDRKADRPVLGVMLMLGFCVMAPIGDASAKALGATMAAAYAKA